MSGDIHFGFDISADNLREFEDALKEMGSKAVLAGFPQDKDEPRQRRCERQRPTQHP